MGTVHNKKSFFIFSRSLRARSCWVAKPYSNYNAIGKKWTELNETKKEIKRISAAKPIILHRTYRNTISRVNARQNMQHIKFSARSSLNIFAFKILLEEIVRIFSFLLHTAHFDIDRCSERIQIRIVQTYFNGLYSLQTRRFQLFIVRSFSKRFDVTLVLSHVKQNFWTVLVSIKVSKWNNGKMCDAIEWMSARVRKRLQSFAETINTMYALYKLPTHHGRLILVSPNFRLCLLFSVFLRVVVVAHHAAFCFDKI